MGATNSTLHYQLSQFISTDKPAWLQDYNGDMQKIDTGINGALTAAESAQNSADSASSGVSTLGDAVSALTTTVSGHTSDITDLTGDVNTIESLIGNGIPTAGDHTLIGAINANTSAISDISNGSYEFSSFNIAIGGTLAAPYEVPADGYVTMSAASGTSIALRAVNEANGADKVIIGFVDGSTNAVFVRKGMKIYQTINGTGTVSLTYSALRLA